MSKSIWAKLTTKLGVAAIITIGVVFTIIYLTEKGCSAISEIAEKFKSGNVVTEFRSYGNKVTGVQRFQVATLEATEILTKIDLYSLNPFDFKIGSVLIEAIIPVEYNYYLDFNDKWNFEWDESLLSIKVVVPKIKPNKPAVDISKMRINVLEGGFLRDKDEVKDSLLSSLTDTLSQKAYKNIPEVKESARQSVKHFISTWLNQFLFKDYETKPKSISVFFEDEINRIEIHDSIKINRKLD